MADHPNTHKPTRKSRSRLAPQKSRKKLTETAKRKKKAALPKKGPLKKVRRKLGKPVRFFKKLFGKDKDKKKK